MARRIATLGAAAACAVAITCSASAAPLNLGIDEYGPLGSPSASVRDRWIVRAAADGAQLVRITVDWAAVAPAARPPGFDQTAPGSSAYAWAPIDAFVRELASQHVSAMLDISGAPAWAQGPGRPAAAAPGTWRPNARDFGQFAYAAARRYSGHFPDPFRPGHNLPRVRFWEAWNEPNLPEHLAPQWIQHGHRFSAESPTLYRGLLNAFYTSVKKVSRSNVVLGGATAPFGDPEPGGTRIPPVTFIQDLLCLKGSRLRGGHCGAAARFDVLDHHPFDIGGPSTHAIDPGDVSVPDMGKLSRLLRAARRANTLAPRTAKRLWATELVWTSRPPDPGGVPLQRHARWLEQALYVLWRQGVDTVLWLQIVDDPPASKTSPGLFGGLYFHNGRPKPAVTAYRFPFVTVRSSGSSIRAWGRAPERGTLLIQRRAGRRWITLTREHVTKFATFFKSVPLRGSATLRARLGTLVSLSWPQA